MPAPVESPDAIPDLDADPLFQPDVVHAPQGHGGVAVEHDSPKLVDAAVEIPGEVAEGRGIALSKEHCLTHWPKSPFCDSCNRARLYSKRARLIRQSEDRIDLPDPDAFGQQLACDHIIVFKSAKGEEHAVFIIQDRFSKFIPAYPSVSRDAAQVASSFKHFVGLRGSDFTIVKSDAAGKIPKAVVEQGWLSEASVPSRFPHNWQLEREIRSFQEVARSLLLQAAFAARPQLWPQACSDVATIMSAKFVDASGITRWKKGLGEDFFGPDYLLGQLAFVRTKQQGKFKFSPNAEPAFFVGWRLDFGLRYKGVLYCVLYSHLKEDLSVIPISHFMMQKFTFQKKWLFLGTWRQKRLCMILKIPDV